MNLEVVGGEDKLVFRRKHEKGEVVVYKKGPREIIGVPGEWIDGVINVDRYSDLLEEVITHIESNEYVDRMIVKVENPHKKIIRLLDSRDFVHLGLNNYMKVLNNNLRRFFSE